eukprot:5887080-Prorocentrum_lima.AAC.1
MDGKGLDTVNFAGESVVYMTLRLRGGGPQRKRKVESDDKQMKQDDAQTVMRAFSIQQINIQN